MTLPSHNRGPAFVELLSALTCLDLPAAGLAQRPLWTPPLPFGSSRAAGALMGYYYQMNRIPNTRTAHRCPSRISFLATLLRVDLTRGLA